MNDTKLSIGEIHYDIQLASSLDYLNKILNTPPPSSWVKCHPLENSVKYLPIEKVEYLLVKLFQTYTVTVKDWKLVANSICVQVTITVINPTTGKEWSQDGLGAVPLQTDKGAGATEFDKIKSSAVMKALPAAESFAIKDAAEKFGAIFGSNLNRRDVIAYSSTISEDYYATKDQIHLINSLMDTAKITDEDEKAIKEHIRGGMSFSKASEIIDFLKNPSDKFCNPAWK